jgi:glycosyltransferase involved in cell wall biosynthesis
MVGQGISAGRVSVVHNGIDPQPYLSAEPADLPVPPGVFVVGTVAHLSPKKGFAELLRAAARVPGAHFVIAGDGPMRPELARAAQAELKGRLHLLGWREDVPALMRRIDAYCLPSRREPFGLVLVEAMAAGRPVVAFRSGGAPEVVVDGETGLLAPPGDADALAACIQRLAGDPQLRRRLGDAGRSRALSHFTLDRQAARLLDEFRSVVAAARP